MMLGFLHQHEMTTYVSYRYVIYVIKMVFLQYFYKIVFVALKSMQESPVKIRFLYSLVPVNMDTF